MLRRKPLPPSTTSRRPRKSLFKLDKGVVATTTGGSKVTVKAENAAKVEIAEDNTTGRLTFNATQEVEDIEIVASKPDLNIGGSKIKDSSFVFEEGVTANLVSTSKLLKNASFTMQAGKDKATFTSGTIKKSTVDTGGGSDDIVIGTDARVKKATFDLGSGKDEVVIEGEVKKAEFNMGDDTQRDKVIIESLDSIKKKLTIENFGKRDKLIIEGERYGYKTLRELDGILGDIEISFQDDEANSNADIVPSFDFSNQIET